jgi:hypothetical protein
MWNNKRAGRLKGVLGKRLRALGGCRNEQRRELAVAASMEGAALWLAREGDRGLKRRLGALEGGSVRESSLVMVVVWARGGATCGGVASQWRMVVQASACMRASCGTGLRPLACVSASAHSGRGRPLWTGERKLSSACVRKAV